MGNDKLTKHFKIGDYEFTIGLNREMAVRFLKKQPKYYDCVKTLNSKAQQGKESIKDLEFDELADQLELMCKMEDYSKEIVDYALPEMLAYGDDQFVTISAKAYAEELLAFCKENDILYNMVDDDNKIIKGFYTIVMEFIQLGFMHGLGAPKNKASKVRIITE